MTRPATNRDHYRAKAIEAMFGEWILETRHKSHRNFSDPGRRGK